MEGEPLGAYAIDKTGDLVALAAGHGQGILVNLNSGHITQLCGSPERIDFLSFSPDSRYLLTTRYHHKLGESFQAGGTIPRHAYE